MQVWKSAVHSSKFCAQTTTYHYICRDLFIQPFRNLIVLGFPVSKFTVTLMTMQKSGYIKTNKRYEENWWKSESGVIVSIRPTSAQSDK